jgi:hypothetical protein
MQELWREQNISVQIGYYTKNLPIQRLETGNFPERAWVSASLAGGTSP